MGAAARLDYTRVLQLAKVGGAFVWGTEPYLWSRDLKPHFARPGDLVWNDDLVAVGMVAPRVGPYLYH